MSDEQKLFIVDLESVSLFSKESILQIVNNEEKYKNTPFLFLIASLVRNQAVDSANRNLAYIGKAKAGSWMIYSFQK